MSGNVPPFTSAVHVESVVRWRWGAERTARTLVLHEGALVPVPAR